MVTPVYYAESMASESIKTGRAFDRLINFSDAVVAVAITVLVLPIADVALTPNETSAWDYLSDQLAEITTFFFTFFVVAIMWLTHNRIMNKLRGYDNVIFWLNTAYLAVIAFLPVTSALYADARQGADEWFSGGDLKGSGMVYWCSLSLVSVLTALMGRHARKRPELYEPDSTIVNTWRTTFRGWAYAVYFLLIGVVSLFSTQVSSYLPLGLILLPFLFLREGSSRDTHA